jgi:hypothetical protein
MYILKKIPLLKLAVLSLIPFNLKLLLVLPFLLRKRFSILYSLENFKIQALLFCIIFYVVCCDFIFSNASYLTIQHISPFMIALFISFVRIDMKFLAQLKKAIYIVFFVDFSTNILSILINLNLHLDTVNYFDSYYHSLVGIFGHPYLSVTLSCVTLLYAILFKERRMQIFALSALLVGSTFRSLLFLYPIILVYVFLARRINSALILVALLLGVLTIFQFVKTNSNLEEFKRCDVLDIHTNLYTKCAALNSSALRYYAWTSFLQSDLSFFSNKDNVLKNRDNYFTLTLELIEKERIFESPYLQAAFDYGILYSCLHLLLFLFLFYQNYKKYIKIRTNSFSKNLYSTKVIIASLFFFDSFYGTFFFCIISSLTIFFILFYDPKNVSS